MEIKEYLNSRKDKVDSRLTEIRACEDDFKKRVDEIKEAIDDANKTEEELKALEDEVSAIDIKKKELEAEKMEKEAELQEIEAQLKALEEGTKKEEENPNPERSKFLVFEKRDGGRGMTIEERKAQAEEFRKLGKKLLSVKEMRATLVSSGTIATPTEVNGIEPTFNQVSSIVDLVKVENCEGMGANKVAYEVSIGTANAQTEGEAITSSDPIYNFVTIQPTSYGILSAISNQVMKQSPLDYEGKIVDSAEKSLRVKCASVITNAIINSTLLSKPEGLALSTIDDNTLRKIAFSYGSDETIYGDAWLFLTKKDLIAFGDVRGTNGNKSAVYEITPDTSNPNTGVIKDGGLSVRYCLNPNLTALADASANGVAMFYGQPKCAELDLFSDYEVKVSEDYQFANNMLTIRGTMDIGCDIIKKDGFVAVTKA